MPKTKKEGIEVESASATASVMEDPKCQLEKVSQIAKNLQSAASDVDVDSSLRTFALVLSTYFINNKSRCAATRLLKNRNLDYYTDISIDLRQRMAGRLFEEVEGGFDDTISDILILNDEYSVWAQEKFANEVSEPLFPVSDIDEEEESEWTDRAKEADVKEILLEAKSDKQADQVPFDHRFDQKENQVEFLPRQYPDQSRRLARSCPH